MNEKKNGKNSKSATASATVGNSTVVNSPMAKALETARPRLGSVLVVYLDDESELLKAVSEEFEAYGFSTYTTTKSEDAITFIASKQAQIALIVSDLKMPQMSGFDFRDEILKIAPNIPFAILSAFIDKDIALMGVAHKISTFLNKPLESENIEDLLTKEVIPRVAAMDEERELVGGFVSDGESLLEKAEELLLALDGDENNVEALNSLFGIVHTMKGSAGFFEPKTLNRFAHKYEDILKKLQNRQIRFSAVSGPLFKGLDVLKKLLGEFKIMQFEQHNEEHLLKTLDADPSSIDSTKSNASSDKTERKIFESGPSQAGVPGGAAGVQANAAQNAGPNAAATSEITEIRVPVDLLDEFLQMSGEVTVIRNMLNKCVRSIEKRFAGDRDVGTLAELLVELHSINGSIQHKITEIRKVSLKEVFRPIPRAVRDVSKQLKKKIEFTIKGDDLRVDTSIADVLNKGLLHLVKNSMDHGIETPEVRLQKGKIETGKLSLVAAEGNDKVTVEIQDDGAGINCEAIKKKMLQGGKYSSDEIEKMSEMELHKMIFSSGFSTAQNVTDISGRGVGMSVVKDSVESRGGEIEIESVQGEGTKFRLVLPIPKSVVIVSCLFMKIDGQQFGISQDEIVKVLLLNPEEQKASIRTLEGVRVLLFENEIVPICDFQDRLNQKGPSKEFKTKSEIDPNGQNALCLIILSPPKSGLKLALHLDETLDIEDAVLKKLHFILNPIGLYRGATFLDDGRIGLVLATHGVMELFGVRESFMKINKKEVHPTGGKEHDVSKINRKLETCLLVRLQRAGMYGISEESIFRIEEFSHEVLMESRRTGVILYREGLLEIANLEDRLKDSHLGSQTSSDTLGLQGQAKEQKQLVVVISVKQEGIEGLRKVGIPVEDVIDIIPISEVDNRMKDSLIAGHFIHEERVIALLNTESLVKRASQGARAV